MLKSLSSVSLALLLAATPLVAQETTDQETTDQTAETAEQDAEAPAPNADQLLDLGSPFVYAKQPYVAIEALDSILSHVT